MNMDPNISLQIALTADCIQLPKQRRKVPAKRTFLLRSFKYILIGWKETRCIIHTYLQVYMCAYMHVAISKPLFHH